MANPSALRLPRPDSREETRPPAEVRRFDGGRGGRGRQPLEPGTILQLGVWVALAPVLMFFLSLVSAYIVRSGLGEDWQAVAIPGLFWFNTALLLAASGLLEVARRRPASAAAWVWGAAILGAGFLVGQWIAWRSLLASGVGLGTTPHASFLYVLSGTHAAHIVLGVAGLVAAAAWPAHGRARLAPHDVRRAATTFWHFLGFLWVGLFGLLVWWR